MIRANYISSLADIPVGPDYVLVEYGPEGGQMKHPRGFTITVARSPSKTVSELSFLANVHLARGLAKREGISSLFACPGGL